MKTLPPLAWTLVLLVISVAVGFAAISNQSFWMDEGGVAFKALIPEFKEWWKWMRYFGTSDMQMLPYMFQAWLWHQMGALSEFALRTVNIPWLVITVLVLRRVKYWPLVCLTSPFVIFYAGELRAYMMVIATGAVAAAALARLIRFSRDPEAGEFAGLHAWCGACLFLCVGSLIGGVWAAGLGLAGLSLRTDWLRKAGFWLRALPWLMLGAGVGAYYWYTLTQGWRAWSPPEGAGILNVMFGFYELAGLYGLGPDRDVLRTDPWAILSSLWLIIPAILVIGGAWVVGVKHWLDRAGGRERFAVAVAVLVPLLLLVGVGFVEQYRIIGRHLAPLIVVVLLPLAGALSATGRLRRWGVTLGLLAFGFMLMSSLRYRFLEDYARDDFRSVVPLVFEALRERKTVLWHADMQTPRYYAYREGGFPMVNAIQQLESDRVSALMFADMVVINRRDIQPGGLIGLDNLERNDFELTHQFTGFEVWEVE